MSRPLLSEETRRRMSRVVFFDWTAYLARYAVLDATLDEDRVDDIDREHYLDGAGDA